MLFGTSGNDELNHVNKGVNKEKVAKWAGNKRSPNNVSPWEPTATSVEAADLTPKPPEISNKSRKK